MPSWRRCSASSVRNGLWVLVAGSWGRRWDRRPLADGSHSRLRGRFILIPRPRLVFKVGGRFCLHTALSLFPRDLVILFLCSASSFAKSGSSRVGFAQTHAASGVFPVVSFPPPLRVGPLLGPLPVSNRTVCSLRPAPSGSDGRLPLPWAQVSFSRGQNSIQGPPQARTQLVAIAQLTFLPAQF